VTSDLGMATFPTVATNEHVSTILGSAAIVVVVGASIVVGPIVIVIASIVIIVASLLIPM